jgi:CRISPR-associated protein Csd2
MKDGRFETDYWDARLFGSTFLESRDAIEKETGKKLKDDEWQKLLKTIRTGVAHFGVGVSVAPVNIRFETWTNKAGVEEGKDRGLAPQALKFVEHGIYTVPFFVNPTQANKTKCTSDDVDLMLHLLKHTFSDNQSTGRTQVEITHAHSVKHISQLGSFSDFALLDALRPYRVPDDEKEKPSEAKASDLQVVSEI